MTKIQVKCWNCGNLIDIELDMKDFNDWRNGKLAQEAFPYLNSGERELLISQTCSTCFDKMWEK